ncbi:MAG: hypothetical protein Q9206_001254 [Seirophora lacunosa]
MQLMFPRLSNDLQLTPRTNVGNGIELRVLPLGDSITNGFQSTDNNGYRLTLQRKLAGSKLLIVGSTSGGTMDDNYHEGWNGFTINQIAEKARLSQFFLRPNIILVHAGTNDLNSGPPIDPDHAPDRLGALVDQLISYAAKDTVILVAQIIKAANAKTQSLIEKYNDAIPGVVARRAGNNHVAVVNFRDALSDSDYADGLHPNDVGYKKMGEIWFKAIQTAADKGWIKVPEGPPPKLGAQGGRLSNDKSHCLTAPFWAPALGGKPIASGVGHNGDMKWTAKFGPRYSKAFGGLDKEKNGTDVMFADLNGDGRADYLYVNRTTGSVILYLNTGTGDEVKFEEANGGKDIASGLAPRNLVRFADINLDGKDDYCVIGKDTGSVTVWLNQGAQANGWGWDGPHKVASGAIGAKGVDVFFADVNGRPDYLVKNSKGGLDAYLNIGKPKTIQGIEWKPAGHIAQGTGTSDVVLADINGDGRADYLTWTSKGGLTGYLNYRTEKEGQPGWAPTGALGSVAGGVGRSSAWCRLADLNGDGKADYIVLGDRGEVEAFINKGTADTSVVGDGVRLADLNGDGFDDYIFLEPNAAVRLYINGGEQSDGQNWVWVPFDSFNEIANGAGAKREEIIFADMDGDGKDDFVIVNPKTGALTLYKSGGQQPDGKWGWIPAGEIATGLGGPGTAVRLADLDGDGKADYIQLGDNGEARLYLNGGPMAGGGWNWRPYNDFKNIADGIGFTRDHVQFKDIDGDRRADYIGVDQLDGHIIAFRNLGPKPGGWGWTAMNDGKKIADGIGAAGADVLWGRLEKTNRYSYVGVSPNSGALRAYKNGCTKLSPATDSSGPGQGSPGSGDSGSGSNSGSSGGSGGPSGGDGSGGNGPGGNGPGDGSGSGNPGSDAATYITGGLLIPLAGLASLNLPTKGVPALTSLRPYAITVQNDVAAAQKAVENLKKSKPTSAGVSTAADVVEKAAKDLEALSAQVDQIDTASFDPSTASAIEQQQNDLRDASRSVSEAYPRLRGCVSSPSACDSVFTGVLATLTSAAVTAPVVYFGSKGVDPQSSNGQSTPGGSGSGGSGSGGSESGGPGGLGGSGGCNPISPLRGGLPLPSGGLGSLGLPRLGTAAVTALRPFAITAQRTLGAAADLLCGLGDSAPPELISSAANTLSGAASDFAALSSQFDAIELSSFSGDAFTAVQTQGVALRGASSALGSALKQLQTCISSNSCKTIIGTVIVSITANEILNPANWFLLRDPYAIKPSQTSKVPSAPGATSTSTSSPLPWVLNTRSGTSLVAFKAFIQKLPDQGGGRQIVYESLTTQFYVTSMTFEEAMIVHAFPIVDQMVENTPVPFETNAVGKTAGRPHKRANGPRIVSAGLGAPTHLRWLSRRRDLAIQGEDLTSDLHRYKYEEAAGLGSFVYNFDAKVDWNHIEIDNVRHELYVIERVRKPGRGPRDPDHFGTVVDCGGHGTLLAGAIAGNFLGFGVAPRATVVEVVWAYGYSIAPFAEDIVEALAWAINDVRTTPGKKFRSVFNISWLFQPWSLVPARPNPDRRYERMGLKTPSRDDMFLPLLAEAWLADIPITVAAGNLKDAVQGDNTPQRFANPRNPLIVVGALQADGNVWRDPFSERGTTLPGPSASGTDPDLIGALDVSARGKPIQGIVPDPGNARIDDTREGTSVPSAEISALLAYFMSLPAPFTAPVGNLLLGNFAFSAKQLLVALSRNPRGPANSPDTWGHAYNNIFDIITSCPGQPMKRSDEPPLNGTNAAFWEEVERLYWVNKGLAPPKFKYGVEADLEKM